MKETSRTIVLKPSAAKTATGTEAHVVIPDQYVGAIIMLDVTAAGGTSPTLIARIQQGIRPIGTATVIGDATNDTDANIVWDDYAAFASVSATGKRFIRIAARGSSSLESASSAGALAAGTIRAGALGSLWRAQYTLGGTNPSFTFSVVAQLLPA